MSGLTKNSKDRDMTTDIEEFLRPTEGWYASNDGERFYIGPHDSQEECIAQAEEDSDTIIVAFCKQSYVRLSDYFCVGDWLTYVADNYDDLVDPEGDDVFDLHVTGPQMVELEKAVTDTVRAI